MTASVYHACMQNAEPPVAGTLLPREPLKHRLVLGGKSMSSYLIPCHVNLGRDNANKTD